MNTAIRIAAGVGASLTLGLAATPSWAAFMITQAAGANYVPMTAPTPCGSGTCVVELAPATVVDIGVLNGANTAALAADLLAQKPLYTVNAFGAPLDINFVITQYAALINAGSYGGQLVVDYVGNAGFAAPEGLHWIQVVTNNWNFTGINGADLAAAKGRGKPENVIDAPGVDSPYYDEAAAAQPPPNNFNAAPPHFGDFSGRPAPNRANPVNVWNASLFLVADDGEHNLTVYNGVQWGWRALFTPRTAVPEPVGWMILIMGFGLAGASLRRRAASAP